MYSRMHYRWRAKNLPELVISVCVIALIVIVTTIVDRQIYRGRPSADGEPLSMVRYCDNTTTFSHEKDGHTKITKLLPIHMEMESLHVFLRYVSRAKTYLEWGSGGSTQLAPYLVSGIAVSIEHNMEWCRIMLEENIMVATARAESLLFYHCVNTHVELQKWGLPAQELSDEELVGMATLYLNEGTKALLHLRDFTDTATFDFVLIDGRFRVACALHLMINGMLNPESLVMIHDFSNRKKYHVILRYYDMALSASHSMSSVLLRPKHVFDRQKIVRDYVHYLREVG